MKKLNRRKIIRKNPLWNMTGRSFLILIVLLIIIAAIVAYYIVRTLSVL